MSTIACVAPAYPWPTTDGYRQRLANMVRALADVGSVDFVWHAWNDQPAVHPAVDMRVLRVEPKVVPATRRDEVLAVSRGLPRALAATAVADLSETDVLRRYDLVYHSNVDVWFAYGNALGAGATIVDFDNLRNVVRPDARSSAVARLDAALWGRLQRRAAAASAAVTVCSELDVGRSGCANAVSIPNGYERVRRVPDERRAPRTDGGTLLFVGLWSYSPNAEGARWFVDEALPLLRRSRPEIELRLVGRDIDSLGDVTRRPGVNAVGEVADLGPELDRADVAVVPLLSGAGTRLKVLESFANRLPLVATTVGIEGIDCVDGRELLVADSPASMSEAIVRMLSDETLRKRLVDAGEDLWSRSYQWAPIREKMSELARRVIADAQHL